MRQGLFLQGHFLRHKFLFMIFFVLVCFQDEFKQLSSWDFFDWNRFGNRLGNDVSRLKKQLGSLGVNIISHHLNFRTWF